MLCMLVVVIFAILGGQAGKTTNNTSAKPGQGKPNQVRPQGNAAQNQPRPNVIRPGMINFVI